MAGRGAGKTRSGAEWVRDQIDRFGARRVALIAPTSADVRDVMVEGESGFMAICPPWSRPRYEPSKRRLTWPNGAIAHTYSADEPERLRGPQHDLGWLDELGAWRYPKTYDMFLFGLRLGKNPRAMVTTTPRMTPLVKEIVGAKTTAITRGSTYENKANLAPEFIEQTIAKYEGTRLGRQEIHGELLTDNPGALWKLDQIDALRVEKPPDLKRVVVAIDPAASNNPDSDETGIVVVGLGADKQGYVLADLSMRGTPEEWAQAAVKAYRDHKADRILAEANNGGQMVESVIRAVDRSVSYKAVHASRGKVTRAEPVSALYEQGRCHHVGAFPALEDQMCDYDPKTSKFSPDRMDALVWGFTELMVDEPGEVWAGSYWNRK